MPSVVNKKKSSAASSSSSPARGPDTSLFHHDDTIDYSHLVDEYKEPLYVYPRDDPTQKMKDAYASQKSSRQRYINARKQREEYELTMSEKLGKLHNLLRESKERESKALKVVREKTINVYEMELQENDGVGEFNDMLSRLKVFLKKYKGPFPTVEEMEHGQSQMEGGGTISNKDKYGADYNEGKVLAQWIHDMQTNYITLGPHQLAALDNIGVAIPLNEKDNWHSVLVKFQLYSEVYYNTPIKVQDTNGNLLLSIMNETDNERYEQLKNWCKAQQDQYELNGFQDNMDRYTKLVEAGFTFDVNVNDDEWTNNVNLVKEYRNKFGNVHIPEDYSPPKSSTPGGEDEASQTSPGKLKEFVTKVRKLLYHDALSPNRMVDLKKANLYMDMGGRVYEYHVKYCKLGRDERGEKQRTKRKFEILDAFSSQKGETVKKRVVRRNNMDNWKEKLESELSYKCHILAALFL